jgi:hypothetical protein
VLAIGNKKLVDLHARERLDVVNPDVSSTWIDAPFRKWCILPKIACYKRLFNSSFAFCR